MGLNQWIARKVSDPGDYANAYSSGLIDLSLFLAASLVAFSGERSTDGGAQRTEVVFKDHFALEMSGYEPVTKDILWLAEPKVEQMATRSLFGPAYRHATAFLCLYSDNSARNNMKSSNAELFAGTLYRSVATRCAGKFGFDRKPQIALQTIQELLPLFLCKTMLNYETFGKGDGLGKILDHLTLSSDGRTQYAFVVGSKEQPLGCAAPYVKVLTEITENIKRCVGDMRW